MTAAARMPDPGLRLLPVLLALLVGAGGCRGDGDLSSLGLRYEAPRGMTYLADAPFSREASGGAIRGRRASFSGGLSLEVLEGLSVPLGMPTDELLPALGLVLPGRVMDRRQGQLGLGPCVRVELKDEDLRTMIYAVPLGGMRTLVVQYQAPSSAYGSGSAAVERSLGTLARLPPG